MRDRSRSVGRPRDRGEGFLVTAMAAAVGGACRDRDVPLVVRAVRSHHFGTGGTGSQGHPAQSPEPAHVPVPQAVTKLVPDVSKFSTELSDTFSKLTEVLTGVKDTASAEAALPSLKDLEGKLAVAANTTKELGDAGRTSIKTLVTTAESKLKVLIDKVLAIPAVGEKLKPVVDSIMAKLSELGG